MVEGEGEGEGEGESSEREQQRVQGEGEGAAREAPAGKGVPRTRTGLASRRAMLATLKTPGSSGAAAFWARRPHDLRRHLLA